MAKKRLRPRRASDRMKDWIVLAAILALGFNTYLIYKTGTALNKFERFIDALETIHNRMSPAYPFDDGYDFRDGVAPRSLKGSTTRKGETKFGGHDA